MKIEENICKIIENEVPDFLEDRLDNKSLSDFLDHLNECVSCQDELSIQYLVRVGLPKLETGANFSLNSELKEYVAKQTGRLKRREHLAFCAYFLELITLMAFAAAVLAYCIIVM